MDQIGVSLLFGFLIGFAAGGITSAVIIFSLLAKSGPRF